MIKNVLTVLTVLILTCCGKRYYFQDRVLVDSLSKGTDSTYKKGFDTDDRLHYTITSFFGTTLKTTIHYNYYQKERVDSIKSYLNDNPFGHWFEFHPNKELKKYWFFTGEGAYSRFVAEFSEDGKLKKQLGTPLVSFYPDSDKQSLIVLFSTVLFDSIQVEYANNRTNYKILELRKSQMLPMLYEGELKQHDKYHFIVRGFKEGEAKIFADSINTQTRQ